MSALLTDDQSWETFARVLDNGTMGEAAHAVAKAQLARDVAAVQSMLDDARADWERGLTKGAMPKGARERVDTLLEVLAAMGPDAEGGSDA